MQSWLQTDGPLHGCVAPHPAATGVAQTVTLSRGGTFGVIAVLFWRVLTGAWCTTAAETVPADKCVGSHDSSSSHLRADNSLSQLLAATHGWHPQLEGLACKAWLCVGCRLERGFADPIMPTQHARKDPRTNSKQRAERRCNMHWETAPNVSRGESFACKLTLCVCGPTGTAPPWSCWL